MSTDVVEALPPALFGQIKAIQIRTQHLVTDVLAGEYESAFKGRGMTFEEVRPYRPGDEVRHIDWNVTARTGEPHVKVHREERELTVMLLVDVSSSGAFGSHQKLKNEVAAEVAAILAYTAIRSHDRVGLIVFSNRIEHFIPPKKGRAHVWRVIRDILSHRPQHQSTSLEGALDFLNKVLRRRAVVFVISDFLDDDYGDRLRAMSKRHDITAISVADRREIELPQVGLITLEDAETGETLLVDTSSRAVTQGFKLHGRRDRAQRTALFRSAGIGEIDIQTHQPYIDPIVRFFRTREKHRGSA